MSTFAISATEANVSEILQKSTTFSQKSLILKPKYLVCVVFHESMQPCIPQSSLLCTKDFFCGKYCKSKVYFGKSRKVVFFASKNSSLRLL